LVKYISFLGCFRAHRPSKESHHDRDQIDCQPDLRVALSLGVDREEIFIALAGQARAQVGDELVDLLPGDTLIVPPGQTFALGNAGSEEFVAVTVLPVGGRACMPGGEPFVPPWAQ
jgi:mannose-6-phosphate isomerase-like protein (cupin superfamily)